MSMERIEEGNAGAKAEMSEELNATGSIVVAAEVATETVIDERAEVVKAVEAAVESRGAVGTCLALCFRSSRFSSLVKKSKKSRFPTMELLNLSFMLCQEWPCNTCLSSINCHNAIPPASLHLPLLTIKRSITWNIIVRGILSKK